MATPDKSSKTNIPKTVLWNLMGPRKHKDEGRSARDFLPSRLSTVTPADAGQSISALQGKALEQAAFERTMGHRTFPTATAVGNATPIMSGAENIYRKTQKGTLSMARPFFRDSGSGDVLPRDQWNTENAVPFVYANPSGNPEWARRDKATWPEHIKAPEGKPMGGTGTLAGLTEGYAAGAKKRRTALRDEDISANPAKYFLRNLLGLRGTQTTDFEKKQ